MEISTTVMCKCGTELDADSMLGNRHGQTYNVKLKVKPCPKCKNVLYHKGFKDGFRKAKHASNPDYDVEAQ